MSLSWLRQWVKSRVPAGGQIRRAGRRIGTPYRAPCRRQPSVRPMLEQLEDRRLMATFQLLSVQGVNSPGNISSYAGVGFQENGVALLNVSANGSPDTNESDFTAQINWGDSASRDRADLVDLGLDPNDHSYEQYLVKGSHIYQRNNPTGGFPVTVYVSGTGGNPISNQTAAAFVGPMPSGIPGTQPNPVTPSSAPEVVGLGLLSVQGVNSPGNISSYAGVGFQENGVALLDASVNGSPDTTPGDFTAQINWGDSASWDRADLVDVGLDPNDHSYEQYLVKGSHTYQGNSPTGGFPVVVYASGPDGTSTSNETATAFVAPMPSGIPGTQPNPVANSSAPEVVDLGLLSVQGVNSPGNISSYAGVGFQENGVALLDASVNGSPDHTPGDFTAQINWGDSASWDKGDLVDLALDPNNHNFEEYLVKGSHTYQGNSPTGGFPVVVYASGPDGTSTSNETATAFVGPMPSGIPGTQPNPVASSSAPEVVDLGLLSVQGVNSPSNISSTAGVGFQGNGVALLDASVNGSPDHTASDFTAQINWGDSASWDRGDLADVGLDPNNHNFEEFLVKGSHAYQESGSYPVVVYINGPDGTSIGNETALAGVSPNPSSIALSPLALPAGKVGTAYNQTITASGGSGTLTVIYQFTSGSLPAGLHISQNSSNTLTISGTPTAAGSVGIQITGADRAGDASVQYDTLTVNPAAAIKLSPGTLPSGTVGTAYNQTITAGGGSGTLSVTTTLTPGSLPSGLSYALSGNTLTISGTPTAAGNVNFSVTATDSAGDTPATQTYTLTVIPAGTGVSLVIPQPVSTTEGQDFNGTLAIFTAQNANAKAGDFLALLSWGDGGVGQAGIKSDPNMGFDITGEHTYADEGVYVVAITITARSSGDTTPTATVAIVADAALTPVNSTPNATEGKAFTGVVASFTDANKSAAAGDFTATITWGDGHVSAGTVAANGSRFDVSGTNTYAEEGSYAVAVQVADKGGNTTTVNNTMTVADAALTATGAPTITGTAGVALGNVTVATFTDAGGAEDASHYTPTINWGDGTTSTGTVTATSNGFRVSGSHTYTAAETYNVSVTIKDEGGSSTTANSLAELGPAASPQPPEGPAPPVGPVAVRLVPRRFGRRTKLVAEVSFSGGPPPLEIIAPYQKPGYQVIAVEGIGLNADGTFDSLLFTAHRGKRRVSTVVSV
jgi:hypothetical protein